MPRGKFLSDEEKGQIKAWTDPRNPTIPSIREIGRRLCRSQFVIKNYLTKGEDYGKKKATKGNRKLSRRQFNRIIQEAKENRCNATEIRAKLDLTVTPQHIGRILRGSGLVKWRKSKKKPVLKKHHKEARLIFAKNHMTWKDEWSNVVFSDEKKFNLDGPDCCAFYWHALDKEDDPKGSRNFGGGSLMVWAGFSSKGTVPICFISTRTNSGMYTEMLEDVLVEYIEDNMDDSAIFQQDNASIHVSRHSKAWFEDKGITVLEWPACSPDLNPVENLWAILARRVYGSSSEKRTFLTVGELKQKINEEWLKIGSNLIQTLVESMGSRIYQVILKNGGPTKY